MTFTITYSEKCKTKYWGDRAGSSKPPVEHSSSMSYGGLDYTQLEIQLKEFVDPPAKRLTVSDVKKDFGPSITTKQAKHIAEYYNWRKKLYDMVLADISNALEDKKSIGPLGNFLAYDIPEKYNTILDDDIGQEYAILKIDIMP